MGWQAFLQKYYEKYKYHFIVQKLADFPYPWLNFGTPEYFTFLETEEYVSQREVFYDEIVFDIDMDKELQPMQARTEAEQIASVLSERLKRDGYEFSVWSSGGTGCHIHLFFPELMKLNNIDNRILKKQFLLKYGAGYIKPREGSGKIQIQANTTIQLERAPHRKKGTKILLWENKTGLINVIPDSIYEDMEAEKIRNDLISRYFKEKNKGVKPQAIVFLENERFVSFKDGRDRALFILAAFYKQTLKDEEILQKLSDWNKKQLGGHFSERTIKSKIRSARPCIPINYIIDLFDELGIDEKYLSDLRGNAWKNTTDLKI
jgi:hypothetical protein